MKNRLFLRIMSFALVTGLTFSNAQITAFALEAENSIEEVVLTEEGEYETTSQIETVSETETNSETEIQESSVLEGSTETENCTDTEGVIEESEIQETNNEGTETIVDEGETIEDSTIIETETITEDINEALETDIEIMTETEASTEEDAKEYAQTAEADEIEAQSLEATAASTPESDFTWDGTTIVKYNGSAKEVIIPEKAQKIKGWAFSSNSNIESVTISKNITTIENYAFYNCNNLETIIFETTKLDRVFNMFTSAFGYCNINKVVFAKGTTYIPDYLFYEAGFKSGTSITIPETVTYIGSYAFCDVTNLKAVTFEGDKVTDIGDHAFKNTSIESIILPKELKKVNYDCFYGCKNLKEAVIPEKVTEIGASAFANTAIENIILPENLKIIGNGAFSSCQKLKSINLPKGLSEINGSAFYGCSNLSSVRLGYSTTDLIADREIFIHCNIKKVEFDDCVTVIPDNLFSYAKFEDGFNFVVPKNITKIGEDAFYQSNIRNITFEGNKVTEIERRAFAFSSIESIVLPEKLTIINSDLFYGCENLKEVTIQNKVTSIESAFGACKNLEKVVIPASVKSISENAFPKNSFLKLYVVKDSYAHKWALENGYNVVESFSITYHLNGGTNAIGNPTAYQTGDTLTFNAPSKSGCTFEGWYTDSKFTKPFNYTTSTTGNLNLYAKWSGTSTTGDYKINYVTNGGTLAKNSPMTYNSSKNTVLKACSKNGYSFTGWYTDESLTNKITKIAKGTEGDITLYAGWNANTYNIKFVANGKNVFGTQSSVNGCEYGKEITLGKCNFTRKGYEFTGWNTKANGNGTSYKDGEKVSNLSAKNKATITLYAQWNAITYTINYHLDGGTNNIKNPETYTASKKTVLSSPKKEGYTFKGWYTDSAYSNKITNIKKGSSEDIDVYAKWQVNKYNVKFNANKGKGKITTLKNCEYDNVYTLPDNTFTRNGYTFNGWNTKKNGTGESYKNAQEIKNLTSKNKKTVTLYAQWVKY